MKAIDVLVSDEFALTRAGLVALLDRADGVRVTATASSALDALDAADRHRPDVVLISFEGTDGDPIAVAAKVSALPGCRSLLLSTAFPRPVVRQAFTCGVDGIVDRTASPSQLVEAIHHVHGGRRVFDAELTVAAMRNGGCPLTLRELAVLEYASQGETVGGTASRLHLSEGTVRNYLASIVSKMRARNRIDAVRMARAAHWI